MYVFHIGINPVTTMAQRFKLQSLKFGKIFRIQIARCSLSTAVFWHQKCELDQTAVRFALQFAQIRFEFVGQFFLNSIKLQSMHTAVCKNHLYFKFDDLQFAMNLQIHCSL